MQVILSPKYQILIPKEFRRPLALKKGQKFNIMVKDGMIILIPEMNIRAMKGWLKGINVEGLRAEKKRL